MNSPALTLVPTYSRITTAKKAEEASPLQIEPCSFWICKKCDKHERFEDMTAVRPLGRMRCSACGNIPKSSDDIAALISGFALNCIEGALFQVSLPPGDPGPPQTAFVNVCCRCGRSHQRSPKPNTPVSTQSSTVQFRRHLWKVYKELKHHDRKKETDIEFGRISLPMEFNQTSSTPALEDLVERTSFTVHFNKVCTCRHTTCGECLKFKVAAEGEWVARSFELEAEMLVCRDLGQGSLRQASCKSTQVPIAFIVSKQSSLHSSSFDIIHENLLIVKARIPKLRRTKHLILIEQYTLCLYSGASLDRRRIPSCRRQYSAGQPALKQKRSFLLCQVTNILLIYPITNKGFICVPKFDSPGPYGQICPGCGTTHRASKDTRKRKKQPQLQADSPYVNISFYGCRCECGEESDPDWIRFMVGSKRDWQKNPMHYYKFHLEQRIAQSMAYSKGHPVRPGMRSAATAPLPRRLSSKFRGARHAVSRAETNILLGKKCAEVEHGHVQTSLRTLSSVQPL
ncbi:hypothetical protein K491DRAFT_727782 [Lophiostoma macrostomum CBS 122681]|uniref:Probable double zinc ribbon domain-containing protein n=1 Tax=Lophiostoma macrostomum CBS 122681 TaxID=1314788 RepID=A0A6A6SYF1_9PLEO|nr:hypothetical protein K491DRAFT_727782 [Lophiostoma macrostomum CBS 122681]